MNENIEILNLSFLREFCNNDHTKMAQYIRTFLETAPEEFPRLREASSSERWIEVKSIAHSLKPQIIFIGLPAMQLLIEKIELETAGSNSENNLITLIAELGKTMNEATDSLRQTLVTLS